MYVLETWPLFETGLVLTGLQYNVQSVNVALFKDRVRLADREIFDEMLSKDYMGFTAYTSLLTICHSVCARMNVQGVPKKNADSLAHDTF